MENEHPDDEKKPEILTMMIKTEIKEECKEEYDPLLIIAPLTELDDLKDEPSLININEIKIKTEPGILDSENEQKYNAEGSDLNKATTQTKDEIEIKSDGEKPATRRGRGKGKNNLNDGGKLCQYCNLLVNPKKYRVHIMGHTGERPYKCDLCDSAFKEKYNLSVHVKTHTGERNIACTLCDKTFIVPSALKAHMRTHSKEKPYVCDICGKGFSHRANLKPHITTHSEELPFMCQDCGKHFRNRKGLVQHTKVHHVNCKNESCEFCLKYYTKKDAPRIAQKQYEKLRECSVCLQVFKYYTTYKNHMRMHNNENFQCGFCDKTYIDRAALRTHLRKHTGEMPFQCEICGRRFTRRDSYKYHLSTHSEVRKLFHCDICDQGFTHKSSVFKHKRQIHETEKPFRCTFCLRNFQSQECLDGHILRMHGDGTSTVKTCETCRICDISVSKRGYNAHMKKHGIRIFKCRKCKSSIEGEDAFNIHKESGCTIYENQETDVSMVTTEINEEAEEATKFEAGNDEVDEEEMDTSDAE